MSDARAEGFYWVVLGQNIASKPRHLLPLAPVLIIALAHGAEVLAHRTRAGVPLVLALTLQWLIDGADLVRAHLTPSPAAAIVSYLREGTDGRLVLSRDLERMIRARAPGRRVTAVRDDDEAARAVEPEGPSPVFITSEALSPELRAMLDARGYALRVAFSRPRSRYVDSLWNELALFEIARRESRP